VYELRVSGVQGPVEVCLLSLDGRPSETSGYDDVELYRMSWGFIQVSKIQQGHVYKMCARALQSFCNCKISHQPRLLLPPKSKKSPICCQPMCNIQGECLFSWSLWWPYLFMLRRCSWKRNGTAWICPNRGCTRTWECVRTASVPYVQETLVPRIRVSLLSKRWVLGS
jgi:hypothetical protein